VHRKEWVGGGLKNLIGPPCRWLSAKYVHERYDCRCCGNGGHQRDQGQQQSRLLVQHYFRHLANHPRVKRFKKKNAASRLKSFVWAKWRMTENKREGFFRKEWLRETVQNVIKEKLLGFACPRTTVSLFCYSQKSFFLPSDYATQ